MGNNNGAYDLEGVIWHQHSNKLMVKILELWPDKSIPVVDLGCGHNFYCSVLEYAGYNAIGVDGCNLKGVDLINDVTNPNKFELNCHVMDSSFPGELKANAISLEVGEHIPSEKSDAYLDNLTSFGGDIIMSWAVPGQAGVGHINCRPMEWVMDKMLERGYVLEHDKTDELRECVKGCHCSWFVNTLMYFKPTK